MSKVIEYFINSNVFQQIFVIFCIGLIIVVLFGYLFKSHKKSLSLFIDPGSMSDIEDKKHIALGLVEILLGIILIGTTASLITNEIFETTENVRLSEIHKIIKEAFETNSLIRTRTLLEENHINARQRMINLTEAEIRLEIGKEDIVKAIRKDGNLRLRMLKSDNQVYIEDFDSNKEYGSFVNRNSSITIISTQNYSDAGIGHFASTLAQNLHANYISNEFFSTGAPLKSKHINFASNKEFLKLGTHLNGTDPLSVFVNDLNKINDKTKLFVYIGTSSDERSHDVHLLFGGEKGDKMNVKNSTYDNINHLEMVYNQLQNEIQPLNLSCATHEEFDNTKKIHLSQALHNKFHKNTVVFYISTKVLWSDDDQFYYKTLIAILKSIKSLESNQQQQ